MTRRTRIFLIAGLAALSWVGVAFVLSLGWFAGRCFAMPLAAIGARVKAVLDPAGIFNPGRMRAGG